MLTYKTTLELGVTRNEGAPLPVEVELVLDATDAEGHTFKSRVKGRGTTLENALIRSLGRHAHIGGMLANCLAKRIATIDSKASEQKLAEETFLGGMSFKELNSLSRNDLREKAAAFGIAGIDELPGNVSKQRVVTLILEHGPDGQD